MIVDILKSQKTIEIEYQGTKTNITVKKFPYGFFQYLQQKSLLNLAEIGEDGKIAGIRKDFSFDLDTSIQTIKNGLISWELQDANEKPLPINESGISVILVGAPDLAEKIVQEIMNFNKPVLDDEVKKKIGKK